MKLETLFDQSRFDQYAAYLKSTGLSDASIQRKLSSLASFQKFLTKKKLVPIPTVKPTPSPLNKTKESLFSRLNESKFLFRYIAIFSIFAIAIGLGFTLYRQTFVQSKKNLAYSTASAMVTGGRFLSFQGRLTDSVGNPIVSSTNIVFKLYPSVGSGTTLYTSNTGNSQVVVPDDNGIFSVTIGKSHGASIPSSVFTENSEVWLEITAGGEVMNPRQQIATVGYALNSETLQGLPPSASGLKNTVMVIDGNGNLNLGETSPTIKSTSGTMGIEGQAVLIKASDGSGGNITLNPDSNGSLNILAEGTSNANGFVNITNANLVSGNLINASINNTNRGYNFINLRNYNIGTSTLATRFSVDAYGNTIIGGSLSVGSSNLVTNLNADLLDGYHASNFVGIGQTGQFIYTAGNGLNLSSNQFKLGGSLTENTNIDFSNFSLNFSDAGSTFASFSSAGNTFYNPTTFTSSGDVSMAYDLNFTNSSGSNINTAGPLSINAGELFNSSNLTLKTYNAGKIILDSSNVNIGGTLNLSQGASSGYILTTDALGNASWISPNSTGIGTTYAAGAGLNLSNNTFTLNLGSSNVWLANQTFTNASIGGTLTMTGTNVGTGTTALMIASNGTVTKRALGDLAFQNQANLGWVLKGDASTTSNIGIGATVGILGGNGLTSTISGNNITLAVGSSAGITVNGDSVGVNAGAGLSFSGTQLINSGIIDANANGTLTRAGSVGAYTLGLNLNHANTWTATQTFNATNAINVGGTAYFASQVGIGTASPNYGKLQISGEGVNEGINIYNGAGSTFRIYRTNDVGIISRQGVDNYGIAINSTGSIGIGTTAPNYKLDVAGNGNFSVNLRVGGTLALSQGASNGYILTSDASGNAKWLPNTGIGTTYNSNNGITKTAGNIFQLGGALIQNTRLNIGNTEVMYLASNGNVGIGNTSPGSYKLNVTGNANISSTLYVDTIQLTGGCCGVGINFNNENMVGLNAITISDSGPSEGFQWADDTWSIDNSPLDRSNTIGNLNLYGTHNNIAFWRPTLWVYNATNYATATPSSNGSLDFTTTNSGNITFNPGGNVGIGTTNPGQKLDVVGNIRSNGQFISTVAQGTAPLSVGSSTLVTNLNADLLDGQHSTYFVNIGQTGNFLTNLTNGVGITITGTGSSRNIAVDYNSTLTNSGNKIGLNLANANTWTALQTFNNGISLTNGYNQSLKNFTRSNDYDSLINIDNTMTIGEVAEALGTDTSCMTKVDDPTAPASGSFEVNCYKGVNTSSTYWKVDQDSEYIYETWVKVVSSTTDPQRFYAGWEMYDSAKTSFGNSQRYWGSAGAEFDSNSYNDGNWHHVVGRISGTGGSVGQFINGTEYARLVLLMNYSSGDTITRFAGMKLYKSNKLFTSIYAKDGSAQTVDSNGKLILDYNGNVTPNNLITSGKVGVGATGTATFNVVGNGNISTNLRVGGTLTLSQGAGAGKILQSDGSGNASWVATSGLYTASNGVTLSGTDFKLGGSLTANTTIAGAYNLNLSQGSLNVGTTIKAANIYANGNVGIGTSSPGAKLDIAAGAADIDTEQIRFSRTNDGLRYNSIYSLSQGGGTGRISFKVHDGITTTSQATVMSLLGSGNVGIGTTAPTSELEIKNSALSSGVFKITSSDNQPLMMVYEESNTRPSVSLYDASAIQTIRFDTGGDSFFNGGDFGIGTTNPQSKLDLGLAASNTNTAILARNGYGGDPNFQLVAKTSTGTTVNSEFFKFGIDYTYATNAGIGFYRGSASTGGFLTFYTNDGSEKMRLDTSGNVGIGTSTPGYKLHVAGNGRIDTNLSVGGTLTLPQGAANGYILTSDTSGNAKWLPNTGIGTTYNSNNGITKTAGNIFQLGGALTQNTRLNIGNTEVFYAQYSNGNIGIGTTSPTQKLHIIGNIYNSGYVQANIAVMQSSGGFATFGSNAAATGVRINTNADGTGSNGLTIINGGNVGIGTTNPVEKLDVTGNIKIQSSYALLFGANKWIDTDDFYTGTASYSLSGYNGSTVVNRIQLDNANNRVNILNSNVGIGIATPGYKLHVNGDALITTRLGIGATNASYALNVSGNGNVTGKLNVGTSLTVGSIPLVSDNNRVLTSSAAGSGTAQYIDTSAWDKNAADDYTYWILQANGTNASNIGKTAVVNFIAGSNIGLSKSGNAITINNTASPYTASNGLTLVGQDLRLGGSLSQNTDIGFSGFSLTFSDAGTTFASFSSAGNTFYNPTTFTSSGDVSMAYDLNFTNSTSSTIRSSSPLYIQTESPYANLDINLTAANAGKIYLNSNTELLSNLTVGGTFVSVGSTNLVTNLNSDYLDGYDSSAFGRLAAVNTWTALQTFSAGATVTNLTITGNGSVTNNLSVGKTLTVDTLNATRSQSTTVVTNLNADLLDGISANGFVGIGQTGNFITTLTAGTGITISGTGVSRTIGHLDTSNQATSDNSNGTVIQDITLDGMGHITSLGTANLDTRYILNQFSSAQSSNFWISGTGLVGTRFGVGATNASYAFNVIGNGNITGKLNIGGTAVFNSYVGIGTATPLVKLHVLDSTGTTLKTAMQFSQTGSTVGAGSGILFKTSSTDTLDRYGVRIGAIRSSSNNGAAEFAIQMEKSTLLGLEDVLRINDSGSVGIGTTAPGYKLHVAGNGRIDTNLSVGGTLTLPQGAVNGYILKSDGSGNASWVNPSTGLYTASNGVTLSGTDFKLGGSLTANTTIAGAYNLNLSQASLNVGTTIKAANIYSNGNVGIGTSSPGAKLEIVNNVAGINNVIQLTNTVSSSQNHGSAIYFKGYYKNALISSFQNPSSWTGGDLQLQTYSNDTTLNTGIYLNRSGNVGINTTAPTYRFHVNGDALISTKLGVGATSTATFNVVGNGNFTTNLNVVGNSSIGGTLTIGSDTALYRSAANILSLVTGDSLNLVSGNVSVAGTNVITSGRLVLGANGTVGGPAFSFSSDTNTGMYLTAADSLALATGGTMRMQLAGGKVGIGATNGATFNVVGNGNFTTNLSVGGTLSFGSLPSAADNNIVLTRNGGNVISSISTSSWDKNAADDYSSWTLQANGTNGTNIGNTAVVNFVAGSNIGLSKTGNTITINNTASPYTASNGLTLVGQDLRLGGVLSQNTDIGFSGFSLTFSDAGSTFASFSSAGNTFYNPTTFNSSGDVSMAYDLNFTNSNGSNINTAGPLSINAGELFNSSNLTLKTYNAGHLILDSANTDTIGNLTIGGTLVSVGSTNTVTNLSADYLDGFNSNYFVNIGQTGNFVFNQFSSAQSANFWISGNGLVGTRFGVGATNASYAFNVVGNGNITNKLNVGGTAVFNSYVGIGTASPTKSLDVRGDVSVWGTEGYNASGERAKIYIGDNNANVGALYNIGLYFDPGNSAGDAMVIRQATGNVGIGTTAPGQKLDVIGNIRSNGQLISTVATGTAPLAVSSTTLVSNLNADLLDGLTSTNFPRALSSSAFTSSTTTTAFIADLTAKGAFSHPSSTIKGTWDYSGNNDISDTGFGAFELAGTSIQTWTDGSTKTVLAIRPTTGSGANQVLIYNDQGSGYSPGWRQIWTNATDGSGSGLDADLLDNISSAGFIQNQFTSAQSSSNFWISGTGLVGTRFGVGATNASYAFNVSGNGNITGKLNVGGTGVFNSYVGIGTATPTEKLTLQQGNLLINDQTATQQGIIFSDIGGDTDFWMGRKDTDGDAGNNNDIFIIGVGNSLNSSPSLTINYTGNVGIGTTNPTSKLHVVGNGNITGNLSVGGTLTMTGTNVLGTGTTALMIASNGTVTKRALGGLAFADASSLWVAKASGNQSVAIGTTINFTGVNGLTTTSVGTSQITFGLGGALNGNTTITGAYNLNLSQGSLSVGTTLTVNTLNATRAQTNTVVTNLNTDLLDGLHLAGIMPANSDRDFADGTIITTDINYGVTSGDPWILEIKGNSYGNIVPFDIQYQGYIYSDTIISHGGYSNGTNITGLVALNVGGSLTFWFPRQSYWQGFNVNAYTAYGGIQRNRVVSITNGVKPTGTKEVALSANIRQSWHTGNDGTGSGLDADYLDGLDSTAFITTATNGLTKTSSTVKLGGALTENTRLNIGNTEVFYAKFANGNVGFGTTSPLTTVDINGPQIYNFTGTTRGILTLKGSYSAGYNTALDFLSDVSSNPMSRIASQTNASGSKLIFGTSNNSTSGITNTALTINYDGSIGIGTTAPQASLQIGLDNSAEPMSGTASKLLVLGTNNNTNPETLFRLVRPTFAGNLYPSSADFKLSSYGTFGSPFLPKTQLTIGLKSSGSYDVSNVVDVLTLRDNGNIGIGITAPLYKLHVTGDALISTRLGIGATNGSYAFNVSGNGNITGSLTIGADTVLSRTASNILSLASGDTFNLISGNLQIGSTTVINSSKIHLAANGSRTNPGYTFIDDQDTGMYRGGTDILRFTTNSLDRMTILASGNVGIGTTSPTAALEVSGNILGARFLSVGATLYGLTPNNIDDPKNSLSLTTSGSIRFNYNDISGTYANSAGTGTASQIKGYTNGLALNIGTSNAGTVTWNNNLFLAMNGNVGIGTTGPTARLTILGDNSSTTPDFTLLNANGTINLQINTGLTDLSNTFIGKTVGKNNTTGSENTALGYQAFTKNTDGWDNSAFGYNAGTFYNGLSGYLTSADNSLFLGAYASALSDGNTNEIVIGYNAIGNGSNSVTLGSADITKTILQGNVGIGTTNPGHRLTIAGDIGTTLNAGYFSTGNMLLSNLEGGAYFGNVGIKENQWGLSGFGDTWTQKGIPKDWSGIAMSSDGRIQTAIANGYNYIYVSTDYGNNWTQKGSSSPWYSIAMSSDGRIQAATLSSGYIYISTDYGNTWTQKGSSQNWREIAMSSDGKIQSAVINGGYIYISTDYGNTWTQKGVTQSWNNIAMSSDGKIQTANPGSSGYIYVSTDYGNTWTQKSSNRIYGDIDMSSDGRIQTAVGWYDYIYVSTDYGNTWTQKGSSQVYNGVSMSSDGKIQSAVVGSTTGYIYISTDYGNTWTQKGSSQNWREIAMSSDGKIQTAVAYNSGSGYIYISQTNSFIDGNIGIGTTSPTQKLEVVGSLVLSTTPGTALHNKIEIGEGTTVNQYSYIDFHGDATYSDFGLRLIRDNGGPNTSSVLEHRGTDGLYIKATDAGFLNFQTNSTARMVIDSIGNVGIGTGSPSNKLQVAGTRSNTINASNAIASIGGDDVYTYFGTLYGTPNWGTWIQSMTVTNGVQPLSLNPLGGSVGIGTASPNAKLTVYNTTAGDTTETLQEWRFNTDWALKLNQQHVSNSHVQWNFTDVAGNNLLSFKNGLVGIGTTSPTSKLDVYNGTLDNTALKGMIRIGFNNSIESSNGSFNEAAPSAGLEFTRDWSSGGQRTLQAGIYGYGAGNWAGGLAFRTAASGGGMNTRMVITDAGNVGIGTTTPGSTLSVHGDITLSGLLNVGPPIRLTRTAISYNDRSNITVKDNTCIAEFGSNYRTASALDVASYGKIAGGNTYFYTAENSYYYVFSYSSYGALTLFNYESYTNYPVACVRKDVPLTFTRATVANYNTNLSTKDTYCTNEFGSNYQTASPEDINFYANSAINTTYYFQTTHSTYSYYFYLNIYSYVQVPQIFNADNSYSRLPISCIRKGSQTGADLAEFIQSKDESINAGDILSADTRNSVMVQKSNSPYDTKVLGVVPTEPGMVLGSESSTEHNTMIAMAGRIPVKVTSKNGPIHIGDPITSSDIPGVGMKATEAGYVVGKALENYDNPDPNAVNKIMLYVNLSFYDPNLIITSTGEVNVGYNVSDDVLKSLGYTDTKNEIESAQYTLTDTAGSLVTRISQFAQIAAAKIQTGLLSAQNIIAEKVVGNLMVANSIKTDTISPLGKAITIDGDATVSGSLVAKDIQTSRVTTTDLKAETASASTVFADNFITKEGSITDIMSQKINSLRDELTKIVASNVATDSAQIENTSLLADSSNWSSNIASDSASLSGDIALTNNLVVGSKLTVQGDTQLGNAFITGTFTAGEIAIKDNFIETTNTALYIQPSGFGSVHIMGDTLVIAENGNVEINGNLNVKGSLFANLLNASEASISGTLTAENIKTNSIKVATDSAQTIIAESGFASLATSSAQLTSNATAGTATLPAGKTEIVIKNNKLTSQSMVYLTPVGSTNNQVIYVKSKFISPTPTPTEATSSATTPSNFTIALDQPLSSSIEINWWIIN